MSKSTEILNEQRKNAELTAMIVIVNRQLDVILNCKDAALKEINTRALSEFLQDNIKELDIPHTLRK